MTDARLRECAEEIALDIASTFGVVVPAQFVGSMTAILRRHLARPPGGADAPEPTHCFNADDWEVTYEWSDRADLHDDMYCGDVLRVGVLTRLPDRWVACVPVTFDEAGAPDETEMRWFDSFDEANAAANRQAPEPPHVG